MSMKYFVLFIVSCLGGSLSIQLPSYINVCKRDQATINECARQSIETLKPKLIEGLPELGVPSIEPFYIPEIVVVSESQLPLSAVGKDVKVTGAGNFTLKALNVDLDKSIIKARVRFPRLHLEGRYRVDVQILFLPIKGEGALVSDALKCDADLVLKSRVEERNGVKYLHFTNLRTDISIKDYHIQLEGLFNGDKALGEATNQAINQNRGEFLRAVKPYLESTVSKLFLDIANKVIANISYDELLPLP